MLSLIKLIANENTIFINAKTRDFELVLNARYYRVISVYINNPNKVISVVLMLFLFDLWNGIFTVFKSSYWTPDEKSILRVIYDYLRIIVYQFIA